MNNNIIETILTPIRIVGKVIAACFNLTNIKIILGAFRKGGFKQVQWELNAYKLRLGGVDAPDKCPDLFDLVHHDQIAEYDKLTIPKAEAPEVSIIIPVYNQFDYTYNCIKSIIARTKDVTYEIILADDVSDDMTTQIDTVIDNIRIVRNKENQRFLRNCNNAAKHANGKYILFLNNDTQVQEDWLRPLTELMDSDAQIGMTGSKLVYPDGKLQEAGGILWEDGSAWNFGNGQNPSASQFNYVKEADYISGAAIMIRKSLWDEIGGFDDRFAPAYYEDTDLAFEVRKHGYKVVYQPKSEVVHFEGRSNGTDISSGLKAYQVENGKKFYEKWKNELKEFHFPNGQEVFLARDRSRNKKHILVIDHYIPHYDNDAGGRCTYMYLLQFLRMGMRVTFIADNFEPEEPYKTTLENLGIEIIYGNYMRINWEAWLYENGKYFDYVYAQRPNITEKYLDAIKKYCPGKLFYFAHDLHHLREYREYKLTGDKKILKSSQKWKDLEFRIFNSVDVIHVVGSYEEQYLKEKLPDKIVRNIPLYIYEDIKTDISKDFDKRKDILFVGGFGHPPNIDAVKWFASEVFPLILEKHPDMVWRIVGGKIPDELKKLASGNIVFEGFVSDEKLEELYKECKLVVVPLRYGAGVKGKIVESAYYQIPVVTTSIGAEGMSTAEGTMVVVDEPAQFADEVCRLYNDNDKLRQMSDNGVEFIKKYFSMEAVDSVLRKDI